MTSHTSRVSWLPWHIFHTNHKTCTLHIERLVLTSFQHQVGRNLGMKLCVHTVACATASDKLGFCVYSCMHMLSTDTLFGLHLCVRSQEHTQTYTRGRKGATTGRSGPQPNHIVLSGEPAIMEHNSYQAYNIYISLVVWCA